MSTREHYRLQCFTEGRIVGEDGKTITDLDRDGGVALRVVHREIDESFIFVLPNIAHIQAPGFGAELDGLIDAAKRHAAGMN